MSRTRRLLTAAAASALAGVLAACGSGTATMHGSLLDESFITGTTCPSYASGDQVVIANASGKTVAVTSLQENQAMETKLENSPAVKALAGLASGFNALSGTASGDVVGYYTFTAQVPGTGPYKITVDGQNVWSKNTNPALSCGG